MNAVDTFRSKSSGIVARLLGDFPMHAEDGFAVLGNLGHECNGFTTLQEVAPTVKGSRGGFGWAQWTGPRRRAYEAYCARNKLDPRSDAANYAWLFLELKGSEAKALPPTLKAQALDDKVVAFEKGFLRAGKKHYASRKQWAAIARSEWAKSGQEPAPMPASHRKTILEDEAGAIETRAEADSRVSGRATGGAIVSGGSGVGTHAGGIPWADLLLFGLFAVLVGVAVWFVLQARAKGAARRRLLAAAEES